MSKHTKGPWSATKDPFIGNAFEINSASEHIGMVAPEANARLIAAAPEMYEALKNLINPYCPAEYSLTEINSVLAKIDGGEDA